MQNCCLNCANYIKKNKKFCSINCSAEFRHKTTVKKWLNGEISGLKRGCRIIAAVRKYILEKNNMKCSCCGWDKKNQITGKSPLEINHIDGDATNCRESNLEVLCPNCHSLTPTWKALNKGNGNKERHRYSGL